MLVIDVLKLPGTYFNNWLQLSCRSSSPALLSLLPAFFRMIRELAKCFKFFSDKHCVACLQTSPISFVARGKGPFSACNKGNRRRLHAGKHCVQRATSSTFPSVNYVIDLCRILYNKPRIVATFFFQRTTAFELCSYSTYPPFRCLVLGKRKLKILKCVEARLIWQLVIHSYVIFTYIISRRDGENNGLLVYFSPSSRAPALAFLSRLKLSFPSCPAGYLWPDLKSLLKRIIKTQEHR